MKKVLLIGDSIRMSYQMPLSELLATEAEIVAPVENCRYAKHTLWEINGWISNLGKPDIIHWNNGLWDIFRINGDTGNLTSIEEYMHDLTRILAEIRKTDARIIWASTTAVDIRNPNCSNGDIDAYNKAAAELMRRESIEINDLNAIVKKDIGHYISNDYVHLSSDGVNACIEAIARIIRKYL
jgi:hypothetical protein